ncbi:AzlC family ABC transporter permease [Acinetobacter chinensis]|uniref:AzlC family ABC transporter permease n=1 Tax=Acinetobacter chinensis TaxID=2004650 RepID=A0ABU3WEG0_9GAMM|nr:AzlC family ABC transporter permease [Acinetobacter chinensis]MDV2468804.1 AzlC family ABC transporter permease [Acinetobacter chinensis]
MFQFKNSAKDLDASVEYLEFLRGVKISIPMLLGIIPFALVLGTQAAQKGFSTIEVPLLTGLNFAGGSEFAIIEVWTQPPQLMFLLLITFLVNSRHILMGASLAPYIRHLPNRKALPLLFFMCDESWALSITDAHKNNPRNPYAGFSVYFYIGLCFALYVMWVVFTTLGVGIGAFLGDVSKFGFDMAFPAVFLVLLRGMWKGFKPALPWLISLIAAALAYLYLPKGWYVLVGSVTGIIAAILFVGDEK